MTGNVQEIGIEGDDGLDAETDEVRTGWMMVMAREVRWRERKKVQRVDCFAAVNLLCLSL